LLVVVDLSSAATTSPTFFATERFQQLDRRHRVDRFGFDHTGLPGFQIDRAVDVDALATARLFNRQVLLLRRPAIQGSRRMVGMDRVHESATPSSLMEFSRFS
jgi:hypothetical protein